MNIIRLKLTNKNQSDVIHSFAVPALGLKIDAIPGRLNQTSVLVEREGVYYGQCSEICGVHHGFMPIAVEAVSLEKYLAWLNEQAQILLKYNLNLKYINIPPFS